MSVCCERISTAFEEETERERKKKQPKITRDHSAEVNLNNPCHVINWFFRSG